MENYCIVTGELFDAAEPYALWISAGLAAAAVLVNIFVGIFKKEKSETVFRNTVLFGAIYGALLGSFMLVLNILKHFSAGYLEENYVSGSVVPLVFAPLLATSVCLGVFAVVYCILLGKNQAKAKKVLKYFTGIFIILLAATLVMMGIYFNEKIKGDGYYTGEYGKLNGPCLYIFAGLLLLFIFAAAVFCDKNRKSADAKCLAFAGICLALSFALSYVKIFSMPQGGSVTLASMLPVMLFAYVYGPRKGLLVGFVYGLMQALQDPYVIHPAQFLLDYPIAFTMLGLAGIFTLLIKNKPAVSFALGCMASGIMRFTSHVLAGVFAFGAYAKDAGAAGALVYSLVYNCYVLVDVIIAIILGMLIVKRILKFMK